MRSVCCLLILLLVTVLPAEAQLRATEFSTIAPPPSWQQDRTPSSGRDAAVRGGHHVMTGFLIGAVVGAVAGTVFYNIMCEAVDNHCAGSRLPYIAIGAGMVGGLGALIGSLYE